MAKIGDTVYNKRTSTQSIISFIDKDRVILETENADTHDKFAKTITRSTFDKWYRVEGVADDTFLPNEEILSEKSAQGLDCRNRFIKLCQDMCDQDLEIISNPDKKMDTIRYNGKNIFECTYTKNRLNVMCHPNSLTPDNRKRAVKIYPKNWSWSLRAKFIFTSTMQHYLMRTIISDGIYYRQNKEEDNKK